jgi:hypothetical protein
MAAAFLSKGLIGLAVPMAVVTAYIVLSRNWKILGKLRPLAGALVFCLPLLLWGYMAFRVGGYDVLKEFLRQSVWRFSSSGAPHSAPFYFYLDVVFYLHLPWILLLLVLAWTRWGPPRCRERLLPGGEALFPAVWFMVTLLGLSVAWNIQELRQMLAHEGRLLVVTMVHKETMAPFEPNLMPPGLELLSKRKWGRRRFINVYLRPPQAGSSKG